MSNARIDGVVKLYSTFDEATVGSLHTIYRADILFIDPFNRVEGLPALIRYFSGMLDGLDECRFEFQQILEDSGEKDAGQAVLFWTMYYRHKKLASGKQLSVSGNSHLKYKQGIYYHRDYFDAGAMLYERVPLLGLAVRSIKGRMEAK